MATFYSGFVNKNMSEASIEDVVGEWRKLD